MRSRKPSRTATAKRARNGDVKPAHAQRASAPLITAADLRRAVFELASTLAPADVDDLLGSEDIGNQLHCLIQCGVHIVRWEFE